MATREKHIKKVHNKRRKESLEKINNLINGMFAFEYKLKNGDWNISRISKDTGLSRNTIYKYITKR